MSLAPLFTAAAGALDGPQEIERKGRAALLAASSPEAGPGAILLPALFAGVMTAPDAHPLCDLIAKTPLPWVVPATSDDPDYARASTKKLIVELIGPDALIRSNDIRVGLYGIGPGVDYGLRTHPAEEIFVMLAGEAQWKRGDAPFEVLGAGGRSHHPSMMPHATRTGTQPFLCLYIWTGNVSFKDFTYLGAVT